MINLQYNAWVTSILQIIPDLALFIPILIVPHLIPDSLLLVTSLATVFWMAGLGAWVLTWSYTAFTNEGIPSYCKNACEDYKPYLDSTKFLDLQIRAEEANIATRTAYRLSVAYGAIRVVSWFIPVLAFGAYQHFYPRTEEGSALNVQ